MQQTRNILKSEYFRLFASTYGCNVSFIKNPSMMELRKVTRKRSLVERFFSLPWRPFEKFKNTEELLPSRQFLLVNRNTFIGHPQLIEEFKHFLADVDGEEPKITQIWPG